MGRSPWIAGVVVCLAAAQGTTSHEDPIVSQWRANQRHVEEIERRFRGSLSEGSLDEFGRLAFVFRQVRGVPARKLDVSDRFFAARATLGQPPDEFERNLPAIVTYLRLGAASTRDLEWATRRRPVLGPRPGFQTVVAIARDVVSFRDRMLDELRSGKVAASEILTRDRLGRLGDPATLAELERAFRQGEMECIRQSEIAGYAVMGAGLMLGTAATLILRRRRAPTLVVLGCASDRPTPGRTPSK